MELTPYIFNTEMIDRWKRATKTKPIRAIVMSGLFTHAAESVTGKFLLDTLEGREPIDKEAFFCIGEAGDVWQQTGKALMKKYSLSDMEPGGWVVATPKPDNVVECYEFTENHRKMSVNTWGIIGMWGETFNGIENIQRVDYGDFICRQVDDPADQWVVRRKLFLNTYEMLT